MRKFAILTAAAFALGFVAPALAGQPVQLRPDIVNHEGNVTLGDLFSGAGDASSVMVAWGGAPGRDLVLNANQVQATAAAHGLDWSNARGLRHLIARAGIARADVTPVAAASRGHGSEVLVYARDFAAGEVVRPEDLEWSRSPDVQAPLDAPGDPRGLIGKAAKRALRAGVAASARDVGTPQVIKTNDVVEVAYEAQGVKLILQGKAMGPAGLGETFSVMNPGSKKEIQAIATGPDEAVVGPQADRLRVALQSDSRLLAALR